MQKTNPGRAAEIFATAAKNIIFSRKIYHTAENISYCRTKFVGLPKRIFGNGYVPSIGEDYYLEATSRTCCSAWTPCHEDTACVSKQ